MRLQILGFWVLIQAFYGMDRITLTSGQVLEGSIGRRTSSKLEFRTEDFVKSFQANEIRKIEFDTTMPKDEFWADLQKGQIIDPDLIKYKLRKSIKAFPDGDYNSLLLAKMLLRNAQYAEMDKLLTNKYKGEYLVIGALALLRKSGTAKPDAGALAGDLLTPAGSADLLLLQTLMAGERGDFKSASVYFDNLRSLPESVWLPEFRLIMTRNIKPETFASLLATNAGLTRTEAVQRARVSFHRFHIQPAIEVTLPNKKQIEDAAAAGDIEVARNLLDDFFQEPENEKTGLALLEKIDAFEKKLRSIGAWPRKPNPWRPVLIAGGGGILVGTGITSFLFVLEQYAAYKKYQALPSDSTTATFNSAWQTYLTDRDLALVFGLAMGAGLGLAIVGLILPPLAPKMKVLPSFDGKRVGLTFISSF